MLQFASLRGGDPSLTPAEEAALERLIALGSALTAQELDAWFGDNSIGSWPVPYRTAILAFIELSCDDDGEFCRRMAIAVSRLSRQERAAIHSLVTRHPHSRFLGAGECPSLLRAMHVAALRHPTIVG